MSTNGNMPALRQNIYPAIDPKNFEHAFHGKVVLVTGSGRGIGREIALCFAKSGASVAVTGRTKLQVDAATEDVKSVLEKDAKAIGVVADGLKRDDLERLVKEVTEQLGEIDVLVCNAGTNTFMPFHLTEADDWWYSMEINVRSPVELTRLILPSMRKRNTGTLIYTSSRAANANLPWTTAYNSSKIAITRFAGSLQAELDIVQKVDAGFEQNDISTFSIHPGEIETDLHQTAFPEKTKQEAPYVMDFMAKIGKNRPHFDIELPAWTCVFLASDNGKKLKGQFVDCTRDVNETITKL
jgi:NAD(P)-dependent dehydrogenase (short-subunit alcohol dehydrogenase family)